MTRSIKLGLVGVVVLASFAFGRYSAPEKIKTETKVVEVEKKVVDKDTHKETKTKITKKPDGTIVTIIDEKKDTDTHSETDKAKETDKLKEVTKDTGRTSLAALAGANPFSGSYQPVYGLSVQRTILGPISVGVWGLNNGILGVSAGFVF